MLKKTAKNIILVTGGRVTLVALWFFAMIILNVQLGKAGAGVFALCIMFVKTFSAFLGDSLDLAIMRRVPEYLKTDRPRALDLLRAAFWLRLAFVGAVSLAVIPFASWLGMRFLGGSDNAPLVLLAAAGLFGELLLRAVMSYFQANESFRRFILLEGILQGSRFISVLSLLLWGLLTPFSAFSAYVVVSFGVFAAGLWMLPRDLTRISWGGRKELGEIFHHTKWMMMALGLAAIFERMEYYFLGLLRGPEAVGVYHAAFTLALMPDVAYSSLMAVFQPKVVHLYRTGGFREFSRRYLRWAVPLCAFLLLCAYLFAEPVMAFLYQEKYPEAVGPFKVLTTGTLFWLATTPLPVSLLALVQPRRLLKITIFQFLFMSIGGFLLIKYFGILGAALLISSVRIVVGCGVIWLGERTLREDPVQYFGRSGAQDEPLEQDPLLRPSNVPVGMGGAV